MTDMFLYRRFAIVALLITALGVVTANVIQATRPHGISVRQITGGPIERQCLSGPVCALADPVRGPKRSMT